MLRSLFYITSCLIFGPLVLMASEMRSWSDIRGRVFEAKLVDASSNKVKLENDVGKQIDFYKSDLSAEDRAYVKEWELQSTEGYSSGSSKNSKQIKAKSDIARVMSSKGVILNGNKLQRAGDKFNQDADYYAIYYSAHWCPPCRKFTPKLVDFYLKNHQRYNNFEVIFVSSDNSESDMENYMREAKMLFPALDYDAKKKAKAVTKYAGSGIPCLVVVDRSGKVLSDSYVNGKYQGPSRVLSDLQRFIEGG